MWNVDDNKNEEYASRSCGYNTCNTDTTFKYTERYESASNVRGDVEEDDKNDDDKPLSIILKIIGDNKKQNIESIIKSISDDDDEADAIDAIADVVTHDAELIKHKLIKIIEKAIATLMLMMLLMVLKKLS